MAVILGLVARGQSGERKHLSTPCAWAPLSSSFPQETPTVNIVPRAAAIDRRRTRADRAILLYSRPVLICA